MEENTEKQDKNIVDRKKKEENEKWERRIAEARRKEEIWEIE